MTKSLVVLALLAPATAFAGDVSGSLGASLLVTDGNSQSRSVGGKVNTVYSAAPWKNTFDASAINVSGTVPTGGTARTAERYDANDKVDYALSEHSYAFVVGDWEKDLFGPIRVRTSEAAGIGWHFLTGPEHFLDAEVGAGARQTKENVTGFHHSDAIGRFAGKYEWKFADKNSFSEAVKVESGASNTYTESVTALKLAVIGNLSSTVTYTVRDNSDVPPGRKHVDTETAVNLVYDFGKK